MVTINAILLIWEPLKTNYEFKSLLTRRLNTDPLEKVFGSIRQQGGISDNSTPVQCTRAFRKLFSALFLTHLLGIVQRISMMSRASALKSPMFQLWLLHHLSFKCLKPWTLGQLTTGSWMLVLISWEQMQLHVSGCLLQKWFKQHCCQTCTTALISNELDDGRKLFSYFKAYESDKGTFGALHAPTIPYLEYVTQLEDLFILVQYIPKVLVLVKPSWIN